MPISPPPSNQITSGRSVQAINTYDISSQNNGGARRAANTRIPVKNKLKGICSRCDGEFRLQSDGNLYKHGHRGNPCLGSDSTPITGSITQSQCVQSQNTDITNSQTVHAIVHDDPEHMPVSINATTCNDDDPFEHPKHTQAVIKNIPKSARRACSSLLAKLVQEVTDNPKSGCKWKALMSFAPKILGKPNRGGKKRNISNIINKRAIAFPTASEQGDGIKKYNKRSDNGEELRAKLATAKIEEGNLRAAVRILSSDDQPAVNNNETLKDLADKHPAIWHRQASTSIDIDKHRQASTSIDKHRQASTSIDNRQCDLASTSIDKHPSPNSCQIRQQLTSNPFK